MQVTTIGLDLAKNVVHVHGVDARGHVVSGNACFASRFSHFWPSCLPVALGEKPQEAGMPGLAS